MLIGRCCEQQGGLYTDTFLGENPTCVGEIICGQIIWKGYCLRHSVLGIECMLVVNLVRQLTCLSYGHNLPNNFWDQPRILTPFCSILFWGSGDSDLNSTFHLTISQLKSMTKNQLAKQGVFYATYRKNCYSSLSASCYPARQPSPKSFL